MKITKNIYNRRDSCYNFIMDARHQTKKFYMHKIDNVFNVQKIVTIHYQALPKRYKAREEWHDFWEIIYADKGGVTVVSENRQTILKQGDIYFITPNVPHYVESGESEPNIFIISFECRSESMKFFSDKKLSVPKERRWLLQNVMTEAASAFDLPDFDPELNRLTPKCRPPLGGEQLIKNSLESFLIYLLRSENDKIASTAFFISKTELSDALEDEIVRILRESLYGKLTLDDICDKLHYGKVKLCTFFKEKTGAGIYGTYLKFKTDEAKNLIRKGVSFTEIADLLCFDSVSSFSNAFKKYTGMTPKQYRDSIKKV